MADVTLRPLFVTSLLRSTAARVINCTGPGIECGRLTDTLLLGLLRDGTVRTDALGLGLDVTPNAAPRAGEDSVRLTSALRRRADDPRRILGDDGGPRHQAAGRDAGAAPERTGQPPPPPPSPPAPRVPAPAGPAPRGPAPAGPDPPDISTRCGSAAARYVIRHALAGPSAPLACRGGSGPSRGPLGASGPGHGRHGR